MLQWSFLTNCQYEENSFGNHLGCREKQKTKTFLKLERKSEVRTYGVESWDELLKYKDRTPTSVGKRWEEELRQWRVKTFRLLCSHSFVHCEKLIGEISNAITTFNWTNSFGPVTAASRGTLLNLLEHVFFTLSQTLLLISQIPVDLF